MVVFGMANVFFFSSIFVRMYGFDVECVLLIILRGVFVYEYSKCTLYPEVMFDVDFNTDTHSSEF